MGFKRPPRKVVIAVLAATGVILFLGGSLPAWNKAQQNEARIGETFSRITTLNQWLVAGAWLESGARQWKPVLEQEYDRLFPVDEDRETVFLQLAQVARSCGIDPIAVKEPPQQYQYRSDEWDDEGEEEEEYGEVDLLIEQLGPDFTELPSDELRAFRVLVSFEADYGKLAAFLAGLRTIPRALSVHHLKAEPVSGGIDVRMELDFHVQQRNQPEG